MNLKPLFKKTKRGMESWTIVQTGSDILITSGLLTGKMVIKRTKVEGNTLRTPEQQAESEAQSSWLKKKKSGYVETLKEAEEGKTDKEIKGGVLPLLAKVFEDHRKKVKYPVYAQPKLDGHRCIAMFDHEGGVTLWSRTRKEILSVPHVIASLEQTGLRNVILDGELYNHDMTFEELTSAIRSRSGNERSSEVQYYVYDVVMDKTFDKRDSFLNEIDMLNELADINFVSTVRLDREEDIKPLHDKWVDRGFEGLMVRQLTKPYEHSRSDQLLKVKEFRDEEFRVIRFEEGREESLVAICSIGDKTFGATMSGERGSYKAYLQSDLTRSPTFVTVKYFRKTSEGIPLFPVGLRIREDI